MVLVIIFGTGLNHNVASDTHGSGINFGDGFLHLPADGMDHSLVILLAQIVAIIIAARIFGWIFKKAGQPGVIGEIVAGIVLGPSLFGLYFPESFQVLFPPQSLDNLYFVSQIGLILFMFAIGLDLDLGVLKTKSYDAVTISATGIFFSFILGIALAWFLYGRFIPPEVSFSSFGLFFGIVLSVTALPVLARIAQEQGIHRTKTGTIAVASAAATDILIWSVLAVILAFVRSDSFYGAVYIIVFAVTFIWVMIKLVRPFLKRVAELHPARENLSKPVIALFFAMPAFSSLIAEVIGIHALFGAFLAGVIMPEDNRFRNLIIEKIEDVSIVFLLPLFFVYSGLRTQIGIMNEPGLWAATGLIFLVAVTGKFFFSALAAKATGQTWKESLTIGALLNTRGLMVLIILNIGYDEGVFTPEIFTMMIIMALATTFMTSPSLSLIRWAFKPKTGEESEKIRQHGKFNILISFANPNMGRALLRLANCLTKKMHENTSITVMHLFSHTGYHSFNMESYETECFAPVSTESKLLNQKISTLFKISNNIDADITEIANRGNYDLLLVGIGQSIFEGSLLGKMLGFTTRIINPDKILEQVTGKESLFGNSVFNERTRAILSGCDISVGILIDKKFVKADSIIIPVLTGDEIAVIRFSQKMINNAASQVLIVDFEGIVKDHIKLKELIRSIEQVAPNHIALTDAADLETDLFRKHDLMLISPAGWKKAVNKKYEWLPEIPSTLIFSEKADN